MNRSTEYIQALVAEDVAKHLHIHFPQLAGFLVEKNGFVDFLTSTTNRLVPLITLLQGQGFCSSAIIDQCVKLATESFGTSRYDHLRGLLLAKESSWYYQLQESGQLTHQLQQLLSQSAVIFSQYDYDAPTGAFQRLDQDLLAVVSVHRRHLTI